MSDTVDRNAQVLGETLTVTGLIPLLRSPFQGVRANALNALIYQLTHENIPTLEDLDNVCRQSDQTVIWLLSNLTNHWARYNHAVPPQINLSTFTGLSPDFFFKCFGE